MSNYAILEARGMSNIADGRDFVITEPARRYDEPTENNKVFLQPSGGQYPEKVVPISDDLPFSCHDCGNLFDRVLVGHTLTWMFSVFSCGEHRYDTAYLDVFPKLQLDTGHDWHNAFMGLDTRSVGEEELAITAIQGYHPDEEWADEYRRQAKNHYILTPEGIKKERAKLWRPGWLSRLAANG
jgi:hypothetical protein